MKTSNLFIAQQCDRAGEATELEQCIASGQVSAAQVEAHRAAGDFVQPPAPDLKALVQKVHSSKGRHHNQIAMCDLYDACGLSNVRPTK